VTVRSLWTAFRDNFVSGLSLLTLGADIFVVSLVVDKREVGLYAVAVSMTNLAAMLLTAIAAMLLPRMAARAKHEAVLLMRRWLGGALVVGTVFALALEAVMAPAVRILLGRQFVEAIPCARVLIVTWTVVGMYRMFAAATQAQGHPRRASAAEFLSLVFMVVVGAYTANRWGIVAMAWTVCAAGAFGAAVLAVRLAWQSEQSAGARSAAP
jgi:O-antigen/teichoic acid export membrane protein